MDGKILVGLTGGIGSGKSIVASILKSYDIPVYDSDMRAKYLMENDVMIVEKIKLSFGDESYVKNRLNREYLSKKVFCSKDNIIKINSIVHKRVIDDFYCFAQNSSSRLVVFESAIIFENNLQHYLDCVVGVYAPQSIRLKRIKKRNPDMSYYDIKRRMSAQASYRDIKRLSQYFIVNDNKTAVLPQVDGIVNSLYGINLDNKDYTI